MPGIVGSVALIPRDRAEAELLEMLKVLCHEDFYVAGTWVEQSLGVYVGWVAREHSFSDGMPLRNEQGDITLVFSGEEFPEPGTERSLKERGHDLDATGPSYLVHLSEEDASFPAGLNGRFHGLIADRNRGTAVLFNDRYGIHRLYYYESKDAFYFAAEAKAILAVRPELKTLDPRGLGEFLCCGCTLEGRTLFQGVQVLPGGSRWIFRNRSLVRKEKYFEPREWEKQDPLEPEPYYQEIRRAFSGNLPRYFEGRERIAMSLTGGLDTRMVMAWRSTEAASLPCYTYGGMVRDCQDVVVARQVAAMCGQPHQVIRVGEEFLARFAHYAERAVYLTDGCADVSQAPDLYLSEKARKIAPVRMTGLYGSEVLRGVRAFRPEEPVSGLFAPELFPYVRQAKETYSNVVEGHPVSFAAFRQGPWHHYAKLALEQTQVAVRTPFLDNELVRTVFRAPESLRTAAGDVSLRLIADGDPIIAGVPTDRGLGGNGGALLEAVSHGLLEFLFKAEYAYDLGMPQWVARLDHVLSPLRLERLFLGRHKIFHFRTWYRDALAGYVRDILLDPRSLSRSYINKRALEATIPGHLEGNRNYTTTLHKLLGLELLQRVLLEQEFHGRLNPRLSAADAYVS